ncbi:hypothetical protein QLX08_006458 [Tetragonisca angustula]|uniref:Uncharacterized protein n=1 Tax=Tetragonisca angustula TaxID=166442 RepID=A0AAW0ZTL4_9HYME
MSSQNTQSNSNHKYSDRAVTDSVHSRFRSSGVYCNTCNINVIGNHSAIESHFNNSHPSKEFCCYCRGKVFTYIQMSNDDCMEKPKYIVYHKCSTTKEEESTRESL